MDRQLIITNLHGHLHTLESILGKWDTENETLIVLGDTNDYGANSFLIHKRLLQMKNQFPDNVIFLKGEHELLFEKFRKNPSLYAQDFFSSGGVPTLASYYDDGLTFDEMNDFSYLVNEVFPKIDFTEFDIYLSKCLDFYETKNMVFLSKESEVIQEFMRSQWQKTSNKKLFTSLASDDSFKLSYYSNLSKEFLAFDTLKNEIPYIMSLTQKTSNAQTNAIEHTSFSDSSMDSPPETVCFRIENGIIKEELVFPSQG